MERQNEHQEVLDFFGVDPDVEDVVELIEEEEPEMDSTIPFVFEDLIHEASMDREFEAEFREQEKGHEDAKDDRH